MTKHDESISDETLAAIGRAIIEQPQVVGLIDGAVRGSFLVLTFEQDETGDQVMSLETWDAMGPQGRADGELMVPIRPAQLEALAYMLTEARKILEANGLVAKPGAAN